MERANGEFVYLSAFTVTQMEICAANSSYQSGQLCTSICIYLLTSKTGFLVFYIQFHFQKSSEAKFTCGATPSNDHAYFYRGKIFEFLFLSDIHIIRLKTNVKSTEKSIPDVIDASNWIFFEVSTTPMLIVGKLSNFHCIQIYRILGFKPT